MFKGEAVRVDMSFAICSLTMKLLTGAIIILTGKVYIRMLIITERLAITDDRVRDTIERCITNSELTAWVA